MGARGGKGARRLTTASYFTPAGRSIQAKGIDPDVEVLQEVPEELKGKDETKGEAGLRGHLRNGNAAGEKEERGGSSAYVPPDPAKDKQLAAAYEHLPFTHFYLQPMDGPELERNRRLAIEYCLANPQWELSLQTHKLLGIR